MDREQLIEDLLKEYKGKIADFADTFPEEELHALTQDEYQNLLSQIFIKFFELSVAASVDAAIAVAQQTGNNILDNLKNINDVI